MPLEGEKIDELLSGFIDGELNDVERKLVEEAARADVRIEQRILLLRRHAGEVSELGQMLAEARTESSVERRATLADAVIAQARRQSASLGLPAHHYVHGYAHSSAPASVLTRAWTQRSSTQRAWIAGSLATAAVVLLAVFIPWQTKVAQPVHLAGSDFNNPEASGSIEAGSIETSPTKIIDTTDQAPAARVVGRFGDLSYVMVVDIQVTLEGLNQRVLEDVLAAAGIPRTRALPVNAEMLTALDESRMIVDSQTSSSAQKMYLTVVHADMDDIDTALRTIWEDQRHFPNVSLNLAIDARTALVREILNSTGGRFSFSDSFAIPLTAAEAAPQLTAVSPFAGTTDRVRYISSSQRASGWGGSDALTVGPSTSMATILLVTHVAE